MKKWLVMILAAMLLLNAVAFAEASEVDEADMVAEESAGGDALPDPDALEALEEADDDADLPDVIPVWFEEGFGLSLPAGWVSYHVEDTDRAAGIRYALGNGLGDRFLYIQIAPTEFDGAAALAEAVEAEDAYERSGDLNFDGVDFVAFIDSARNASCCSAVWGGNLLSFIFTPQDDSDYMLIATQIMESFSTMS